MSSADNLCKQFGPRSGSKPFLNSDSVPERMISIAPDIHIQSTLVNSTMHNSILSLISTRWPGPSIYTPANVVCGGYTVFTLSMRPSIGP